jgi:transcriptional regulator
MYIPAHFAEDRPEALQAFIRQRGFGALVTTGPDGPEANHLPFVLDEEAGQFGVLRCHVARANPVWLEAGSKGALVIFQGPDAYVSPSWYPGKRDDARTVPTWNYVAVHARGTLRVVDDPVWLRTHLEALTKAHESGRAEPWRITDAPEDYVQRMIGAVVGMEITVTRLQGKWKLSQNRAAADRAGVVAGLRQEAPGPAHALADLMD